MLFDVDTPLWTAVTGLLKGVKSVPVLRRTQMNRLNWKDSLEAGDIPPVIWVVDVQDSVEEPWATDTNAYRYPLVILYLRPANLSAAETTAGITVETAIESKLADARDAFIYYTGTGFQLAGMLPTRSISDRNEFNQILFELQNRFIGGGFDVSPLVGFYP